MTRTSVKLLGSVVFLLDQFFKQFSLVGNLKYSLNTGIAFGLFPGLGYLSIILYFLVGLMMWKIGNRWAFALFVSGALSNTLDRLFRDGVVDYLPLFNYTNLADISIIASLIILSYHIITNQT